MYNVSPVKFGSMEGAAIAAADGKGGVLAGLLGIGVGYTGCYLLQKYRTRATSPNSSVAPISYSPYPYRPYMNYYPVSQLNKDTFTYTVNK